MKPDDRTEWRSRLLKRLAVVVDEDQTYTVRLSAVRAVQDMFPPDDSLRAESPEALLDRVLHAWDTRLDIRERRDVRVTVSRPPRGLRDVWM